jgi:hypothetical protein
VRALVVYTVGRVLVLFAIAAPLYAVGLRGFLLAASAVLLSLPVSYLLLARQRHAFAADIERRVGERHARRADLRAKLRGDEAPSGSVTPE